MGNCIATAVVARWEGVFDDAQDASVLMRLPGRRRGGAAREHVRRRLRARGHDVVALHAARRRRHRRRRASPPSSRRARPASSSTAPPTTTSTAPKTTRPTALAVNAFAVQSMARPPPRAAPRSCTTAPTSCSTATAPSPYVGGRPRQSAERLRLVQAARRVVRARCARRYVLRVESLFGGPAARSSIDKIAAALRAGRAPRVFVDRVVTPSYVDDVVTRRWRC